MIGSDFGVFVNQCFEIYFRNEILRRRMIRQIKRDKEEILDISKTLEIETDAFYKAQTNAFTFQRNDVIAIKPN